MQWVRVRLLLLWLWLKGGGGGGAGESGSPCSNRVWCTWDLCVRCLFGVVWGLRLPHGVWAFISAA